LPKNRKEPEKISLSLSVMTSVTMFTQKQNPFNFVKQILTWSVQIYADLSLDF